MADNNKGVQTGPKTGFGRWMVYHFIPKYENNMNGIVYFGAAFLIIIVGIRGLGTIAQDIPIIPGFLIDESGSLSPNYVMGALFLEFFLLLILALVTFFKPEDVKQLPGKDKPKEAGPQVTQVPGVDHDKFKAELKKLEEFTDEEMKVIEKFVERFNVLNKKISKIQQESLQALSDIKKSISS